MINAILFDLDGVLVNSLEAWTEFTQDIMVANGYKKPSLKKVSAGFNLTFHDQLKLLTGERSNEKIFKMINGQVNFPYDSIKIPKNAKKVLSSLHKKFKTDIVTNSQMDFVTRFMEIAGVSAYIDVIIDVDSTQKHKPNPEPLLLAATRLGVSPDRIVYVGDFDTDVKAAKSAGMRSIIIGDRDVPGADMYIKNLEEIERLVL